jgi:hypothetical protein
MSRYQQMLDSGPVEPFPGKRLIRIVDSKGYHVRYLWVDVEEKVAE